MQDYPDPSPRGFPPLIGPGAWPDSMVNAIAFLLLLLAVLLCYAAYRSGRRYERQRLEVASSKAPEIIFHAIRRQIDIALMATGERAFGPVRNLIECIDAYLGPVLRLTEGHNSLAVTVAKLKKALLTEKKKVRLEHDNHGHGAGHGVGGSTVIIATGSALAGGGVSASAAGGVAAASAVGPGGGVQVVEPARVYEIPAHDPHHHHGAHKAEEKEVELTARERALAVREALESLSDYWQKERVEGELRAAQRALTITRPIGDKPLLPVRARSAAPPPAGPVAKAAREANKGFPLFKL